MKAEILYKKDGSISNCPSSRVALGFWGTLWHFGGYWSEIKNFPLKKFLTKEAEALWALFQVCLWILLFPVLPFITVAINLHSDKKLVREHQLRMKKYQEEFSDEEFNLGPELDLGP